VPLTDDVQALIATLPRWPNCDALFSADGRVTVSRFSAAKRAVDRAMGTPATFVIHDLRRTVRTRFSGLRIPDAVAEMVIGHGRKGIQRVYDQHTYLTEMREALEAWAVRLRTIVDPPQTNVVPISQGRL